jgi:predicted house-cleaning NTP pyrophosphatase (Maf/HAM1 superfamily)
MRLVLGSSSKWRQAIAKQCLGGDVTLIPADIDERQAALTVTEPGASNHCAVIALAKLNSLLHIITEPSSIIMCFDSVVYHRGTILEKPDNASVCESMVRSWAKADERIQVYTAVAIGLNSPREVRQTVEVSDVVMKRDLTDEELDKYLKTSGCLGSSGALIVELLLEFGAAAVEGDQSVIEGFPKTVVQGIVADLTKFL